MSLRPDRPPDSLTVHATSLAGDHGDSHARYLEATIDGLRIINIYLPNGTKWMDRLTKRLALS